MQQAQWQSEEKLDAATLALPPSGSRQLKRINVEEDFNYAEKMAFADN